MPTNENATGAPEHHELRHVFNALFYVVKGGLPWRQMPDDLPPWKTVYYYFRKFQRLGIWAELNDALHEKIRPKKGRQASPLATIIVDTLGLLLAVVVHRANIGERRGESFVLDRLSELKVNFPRLTVIFADGGYSGELEAQVQKTYGWPLGIIRKPLGIKMFVLLPKRLIVERPLPG